MTGKSEQDTPVYELFVEGLLAVAKKKKISIKVAAQQAINTCQTQHQEENIPYIQAALTYLTSQSPSNKT